MDTQLLRNLGLSCFSYPALYIAYQELFCWSRWARWRVSREAWAVYDGWGLLLPTLVFSAAIILSFVLIRNAKAPLWLFYVLPLVSCFVFNIAFALWANNQELSIMLYTLLPCAVLCTIAVKRILEDDMMVKEDE